MFCKCRLYKKKKMKRKNNRKSKKAKNSGSIRSGTKPFASTTTFRKPKYELVRSSNNSQNIIMQGVDLIEPIPQYSSSQSGQNAIFCTVPANPLYWKGTRIAAQASAYQQYRPLKFSVKYVPSVPVTVPGQVVYGTMWNVGTDLGAFQQSLATSNGGGITTCYQSVWSHVRCSNKYLPLRFYNVGDDMTENTTNPFVWIAYYTGELSGTVSGPGYVLLHWKYEFTVGIGQNSRQALTYSNSDQPEVSLARRSRLSVPWGVALGMLKDGAVTVLRSVAIFLLDSVLAKLKNPSNARSGESINEVRIPKGTILSYDLANLEDSTTSYSLVKSNGTDYYLPDDTPCIIWQVGNEVTKSGSTPEPGPSSYKQPFITDISLSQDNIPCQYVDSAATLHGGIIMNFKNSQGQFLHYQFAPDSTNTILYVKVEVPGGVTVGAVINVSFTVFDPNTTTVSVFSASGAATNEGFHRQFYEGLPLDLDYLFYTYPIL